MQDESTLQPLVQTCRADRDEMINLSKLPTDIRRQAWDMIKRHAPDLATLLAITGQNRADFDADVLVYLSDLPEQVHQLLKHNRW